jgi:hypothetical protein
VIQNRTKRIWKTVVNEIAIYAANFIWSVYLLIIIYTLFLRSSLNFTTLHPSTLHFTTLSFGLIPLKFPTTPFHLTSLHFISLHCTSRQFWPLFCSFHFTLFIIAFLTSCCFPMPPHVRHGLRGLPPGCGRSVTDFWGWDAHEVRLHCPDELVGDIWIWSTRRGLKHKFY